GGGGSEFFGQELVNLDLRPKRAAYLFRSGSVRGFRAAVASACTRWGGIQELIIPVSANGRIASGWVQLLGVSEPDVLFDAAGLSSAARARAVETREVDG